MLAIGRCLMGCPELIMLDEPSLGLAPNLVQETLLAIRQLNHNGLTVLLVEQNVAASLKICQRGYVLENGRIVMTGNGNELLNDDRSTPGVSRVIELLTPLKLQWYPLTLNL